jgi:hypothetical protein
VVSEEKGSAAVLSAACHNPSPLATAVVPQLPAPPDPIPSSALPACLDSGFIDFQRAPPSARPTDRLSENYPLVHTYSVARAAAHPLSFGVLFGCSLLLFLYLKSFEVFWDIYCGLGWSWYFYIIFCAPLCDEMGFCAIYFAALLTFCRRVI